MIEITAIIRRDKIVATRRELEKIGLWAMTVHTVSGRGRQGGNLMTEIDQSLPPEFEGVSKIVRNMTPASYALAHSLTRPVFWVPKRMIQIVLPDARKESAVDAIILANRSGHYGDGRIFVSPVEETVQIRTEKRGPATLPS